MAGRRPNPKSSRNPTQVKQFLSHLDLEMLFQNVPTLCHLDMTYGVKSIGTHHELTLALTLALARTRARARTRTRTRTLTLTRREQAVPALARGL